jgi:glycosyltransferase involved in cell wall biosynthesis
MRIGIDLTAVWRPATGLEIVAIEMTKALLRADRKNDYVLFFAQQVHPALEEFAGRYQPVFSPRMHEALLKNIWFPLAGQAAKLDYLHFPVFPPPFWLPCATGWTVPDATPWAYPETMKASSRWYFRILGGRAARSSRVLITDSEAAREDLARHLDIPADKLHVIYPGVKPSFGVRRDVAAFERVRHCYGLPEKFILFVGTLEPRKNLARLLQAFRILKAERNFAPDLVIVGRKGWLCDSVFFALSDEIRKSVVITGYVPNDDLVDLYNMASLLAFPSLYEGFGLPCVEAMVCGCPVVTSHRGALREITGDCALHTDPEDVRAIAEAIWNVSENHALREKLIERGLRRAALFSWDKYAESLLELVDRALPQSEGEGKDQREWVRA